MHNGLKSICIVGGGTAGWMAASLLTTVLSSSKIKITLVESPDIDTVGVGESTIPDIRDFLRTCNIDTKEFVKATSATFKLGIQFENWSTIGGQYFHPFGRLGQDINGFDFYNVWLRSQEKNETSKLVSHAVCSVMADDDRFTIPSSTSKDWIDHSFSHAFHLDAIKLARFLREISISRGVNRVEATVANVETQDGRITSLSLENGEQIQSDFYIDCTGFRALLIEKALNVGYQDWSHYLPCNRAVVVQTENVKAPSPYTIASAQNAGWRWKIPLQHRTGNGYVFASSYCSDDEAKQTLIENLDGEMLTEPRFIPFLTGKRDKILHKNCLALGLASGFIEPLESTAIHLVYKTLRHLIKHFPDQQFDPLNEAMFNQKIDADYEEIRDFIVLHYCTTTRSDTDFWRWCQSMQLPDTLQSRLDLFVERGYLDLEPNGLFTRDSWWAVLEGMNVRPRKNHPLMQGFNLDQLASRLSAAEQQIRQKVSAMPSHAAFIEANCPAAKF